MKFALYTGNRLEDLADQLAKLRAAGAEADPFAIETVVVPTRGMAVYLEQCFAVRNGISAQVRFPFLNRFLQEALERQPGIPKVSAAFSPEVLRWRIFRELGENSGDYPELGPYLNLPDKPELRRFELADKIAGLFDQYQIHAPRMVADWETGASGNGNRISDAERWQARLWKNLQIPGESSFAAAVTRFLERSATQDCSIGTIHVFGVGTMPPVFLRIFEKLGARNPVNFFYLNPCREYWADHATGRAAPVDLLRPDDAPEDDNPLLRAFGAPGRDFFRAIMELDDTILALETPLFRDPGRDTLLHALQQDALDDTVTAFVPPPTDDTVTVHDCHSDFREIEVLHDCLLDALSRDPSLQPRDLLVMAPDIGKFVPAIQAVFDRGPLAGRYSISDRSLGTLNRVSAVLAAVLEFAQGRFSAPELAALLDLEPLRARYGFDDGAVDRIRRWLSEAEMRWGADAEMHEAASGVGFSEYTWRSGFERLLLGLALDDDGVDDRAPLGLVESTADLETFDRWCELTNHLLELRRQLTTPRPVAEWVEILKDALENFVIENNENAAETVQFHRLLGNVAAGAAAAGTVEAVDFELIWNRLAEAAGTVSEGDGFLRGRLTFCSMIPMRSIPRRVIALLGLDHGAFPRPDSPVGFNLLPGRPGAAARSRQREDRYLFLEALLAARNRLLLFYRGRSDAGAEELPPAIPVDEVLGAIRATAGDGAVETRRIRHKLQAFDSDYFTTGHPGLYSYSAIAAKVARAAEAARRTPPEVVPFWTGDAPIEPQTEVELGELERFFQDPSGYFLKNRLGVTQERDHRPVLSGEEPFELDALESYRLRQELAPTANRPELEDLEPLRQRLRARNRLPVGAPGDKLFADLVSETRIDDAGFRRDWSRQTPTMVDFELPKGGRIFGVFPANPEGDGVTMCRFAELKPDDRVRFILRHLALTVMTGNEATRSRIRGREETISELSGISVAAAREQLSELMKIWQEGRTRPLPLFPAAAFAYLLSTGRIPPEEQARRAFSTESNGYTQGGEWFSNPAIARFRPLEWLDDPENFREFAELARRCWGIAALHWHKSRGDDTP